MLVVKCGGGVVVMLGYDVGERMWWWFVLVMVFGCGGDVLIY